jgi:hypothetical protein
VQQVMLSQVSGGSLRAPRPNLYFPVQNLIQFAVAVAAALIRSANPRRLVRPSARVL